MTALEPVSITIRQGEFISIVGPSGCGKSTLLRLISGLDQATGGSITLDVSGRKRPVGFVFQEPVLLPWKTILDGVRFPLDTAGVARAQGDKTALGLIKMVGLAVSKSAAAAAFRRHAPAGGDCPRAFRRSADPVDGRAFSAVDRPTRDQSQR